MKNNNISVAKRTTILSIYVGMSYVINGSFMYRKQLVVPMVL